MKRVLGSILIVGIMISMWAIPAQAQLGIGIKAPPLVLPQLFMSYWLSEGLLLEAAGSIAGFGPAASISVGLNGKLFFDAVNIADIGLHPFVSAGGALSMVSVNVPGLASSASVAIGGSGGGGMEYRFEELPLAIFAELSASVFISQSLGFGIGGGIGVRWEFDFE